MANAKKSTTTRRGRERNCFDLSLSAAMCERVHIIISQSHRVALTLKWSWRKKCLYNDRITCSSIYHSLIVCVCDAKAGTDCCALPRWLSASHTHTVCNTDWALLLSCNDKKIRTLALTAHTIQRLFESISHNAAAVTFLLSMICFDTSIRQHFALNCMCCGWIFIC